MYLCLLSKDSSLLQKLFFHENCRLADFVGNKMRRFYTEDRITIGQANVISGSNARHIDKVLRLKPGEIITILDGHTVTVSVEDSADQLVIASGGVLLINQGISFLVKNGIETDLTVEGTVKNYGSLTSEDQATISFVSNGKYIHKQKGGTLPTALWRPVSTCILDTLQDTAPANGNK